MGEGAMTFLAKQQREKEKEEKKERKRKDRAKKKERKKTKSSMKKKRKSKKKTATSKRGNKADGESGADHGSYPCKDCGKIFSKRRSRAAHMSSCNRGRRKEIVTIDDDSDDHNAVSADKQPYWHDTDEDEYDLVVEE